MTFQMQEHTTPDKLDQYTFLWSELRLVIAAIALFLGGVPPILTFFPLTISTVRLYSSIHNLLTFCWVISGLAVGYLLFRWNKNGQMLFGEKRQYDTYAFFAMVITGINLGLAGLFSRNLGMSIFSGRPIFAIGGVVYLVTAYYLHKRWTESGKKMFGTKNEKATP